MANLFRSTIKTFDVSAINDQLCSTASPRRLTELPKTQSLFIVTEITARAAGELRRLLPP
jgi:hypothetical protein